MQIKIKLAGHLRNYGENIKEEFLLDLPEGSTVQDLIERLQIPNPSFAFCSVNGSKEELSCILQEGDNVAVYPPLAGG